MPVVVVRRLFCPHLGPFLFCHDGGHSCHDGGHDAFGRHGATHDLAQWGVSRSGRESVMAMGEFRWNAVGPPEWECEAMDSVVWVKCATSAECIKSMDSHAHG